MVYPFYVIVDSETRKDYVGVGVKKKIGKLTTDIHQRDKGEITTPYTIKQFTREYCESKKVHKLVTQVIYRGEVIHEHITDY